MQGIGSGFIGLLDKEDATTRIKPIKAHYLVVFVGHAFRVFVEFAKFI
jgi:hypothetical protein